MHSYTFSQIGTFHTNHNEDDFLSQPIGTHRQLIGVMDGCSMGIDSHFAATLIAKLLRKIAKAVYYESFISKQEPPLPSLLKQTFKQLFEELKLIKNSLALEQNELLSTLVVGIVDTQAQTAECLTIGDGLICCNRQLVEYDQDDRPDYIGYHLAKDFEEWYAAQTQYLSLTQVQDLSISTDGIFTFRPFDAKNYPKVSAEKVVSFLLFDQTGKEKTSMFHQKMMHIKQEWGLMPTDDLTMIRLIMDN